MKLFNELGETNVTTTTIADEMDISPGNLYYHFRNKDDIIDSLFARFARQVLLRLRLPRNYRPSVADVWAYLDQMTEFLWSYRFLYRDLNDLLARNRTLETQFKRILGHKERLARQLCEHLVADGEMAARPDEITSIATNACIIATYWLSYQFVMNPRKYNEPDQMRAPLRQASRQIISVMAPYLRGPSRQLFDTLASGAVITLALDEKGSSRGVAAPRPRKP